MYTRKTFSKDISKFIIKGDEETLNLINGFRKILLCNIVYFFTNCEIFRVHLVSNVNNEKHFKVMASNHKLLISFMPAGIKVSFENKEYFLDYEIGFNDIDLIIKEAIFKTKNKIIETFEAHKTNIEIVTNKNILKISFPFSGVISPTYFISLNEDATLNTLWLFYQNILYPIVQNIDVHNAQIPTILQVKDLNEPAMSELTLVNNTLIAYKLNEKVFDTIINIEKEPDKEMIVTLKNLNTSYLPQIMAEIKKMLAKINYSEEKPNLSLIRKLN